MAERGVNATAMSEKDGVHYAVGRAIAKAIPLPVSAALLGAPAGSVSCAFGDTAPVVGTGSSQPTRTTRMPPSRTAAAPHRPCWEHQRAFLKTCLGRRCVMTGCTSRWSEACALKTARAYGFTNGTPPVGSGRARSCHRLTA
jgi:hypothetical protein